MLEEDIKKFKELVAFKLENAQDQELQWEAKAYADCIKMIDQVLKKNGLL